MATQWQSGPSSNRKAGREGPGAMKGQLDGEERENENGVVAQGNSDERCCRSSNRLGFKRLSGAFHAHGCCDEAVQLAPALQATVQLGWPTGSVVPLGFLLLCCTALY